MADNYLEKRMEQHRAVAGTAAQKPKHTLYSLIEKNRSTRLFDTSFVVREDQLRRIVAVNSRVASARNRQSLRFCYYGRLCGRSAAKGVRTQCFYCCMLYNRAAHKHIYRFRNIGAEYVVAGC